MMLKHHLRRFAGMRSAFDCEPGMEPVYRDLFVRELTRLGLVDDFFPVGGAANYSLLYIILRIATTLRPRSVLDIGAGQSTLLWSALQRLGLVETILTLESDADWGTRIAAQVHHEVLVTPLSQRIVAGRGCLTYDWDRVRDGRSFDVTVCDGPNGTPRYSRCGVLAMLERRPPDDFILLLDDVERPGERDTVGAIHARLDALDINYTVGIHRGAKSQAIFAGGQYKPATFL